MCSRAPIHIPGNCPPVGPHAGETDPEVIRGLVGLRGKMGPIGEASKDEAVRAYDIARAADGRCQDLLFDVLQEQVVSPELKERIRAELYRTSLLGG